MADLIIEDGSGVEGANSYVSLDDAYLIAENYGWTLPIDAELANVALANGYSYLDTLEDAMSGERTYEDQTGSFPREGCYCGAFAVAENVIKNEVKRAQVRAAVTFGAGTEVNPDDDGKSIASEEVVGAVKVSYFDNNKTGNSVVISEAIEFLKRCYLNKSSGGIQFNVYRG